MKNLLSAFIVSCLLLACGGKNDFSEGHFPDEVTNFEAVNSPEDDYNMDLADAYEGHVLHFSSNRGSRYHFDIVSEDMLVMWNSGDDAPQVLSENRWTGDLHGAVNTFCNELGPYSLQYQKAGTEVYTAVNLFMYANDCEGHFDIRYTNLVQPATQTDSGSETQPLRMVNTPANELYPTFFGEELTRAGQAETDPKLIQKLLYCSDASGSFDLYQVDMDVTGDLVDYLGASEPAEPERLPISVKGANDKCPYVDRRMMVFTSDRPGGFGGFDLYYSLYENGAWSTPVNFGERINSAHDEYRPVILRYQRGFDNDLLLFSSNRPGGKGGFDLYYVGVEKVEE